MWGRGGDGASLFLKVCSDRTRGNGCKVEQGKSWVVIRKRITSLREVELLNGCLEMFGHSILGHICKLTRPWVLWFVLALLWAGDGSKCHQNFISEVQLWIQSSVSTMPITVVSNVECILVCKMSELKIGVPCSHVVWHYQSGIFKKTEPQKKEDCRKKILSFVFAILMKTSRLC